MSMGFGFSLPAYPLRGGGGNNPFNQSGPTLDLSFTGNAENLSGADTFTLDTNFITPQYQVAAQYAVWVDGSGMTQRNFADIVTFTRGSNATQFDSTGSLVYAPVNLLTWSEDFGNAAWTKQASASVATNTTVAPNGTTTGDTVTADSGFGVYQQLAVTVGTQVTQSVYLRAGTATSIMFRDDTGAGRHIVVNPSTGAITSTSGTLLNSGSVSVGNGWYRIFFSYTADSTLVRNIIRPDSAGAAQTFIVWGGQTSLFPTLGGVTADFATYYPTTTAAYYGPRFDYNPSTLAAQGLLIEEQRTNSIRNNTMQGAVAGTPGTLPTNWVLVGSGLGTLTQTVVAAGTSGGISYVDIRLSGTTSTTSFGLGFDGTIQVAASVGQTWTSSVYLARVGGTTTNLTVNLRVIDRDAVGANVGQSNSDITSTLGTALSRFPLTRTLAGVGTAAVSNDVLFAFASGVAIDITLRIGLPQLERGAFATSVIPTVNAFALGVTREADEASVNTLSPWYNQSAGTLFVERIRGPLDATAAKRYVNISDGSAGTNVAFQKYQTSLGGSAAVSYVAGVPDFAPNPAGVSADGAIVKTALAIDNTGKAMSRDGGTVATSAVLPALSGMTTMFIGSQIGAGNTQASNTWIRRIVYYPRRLANAELQSITT